MKPKRIQRQRIKGWKMPPNTVYVGRPSKWGNPYKVDKKAGVSGTINMVMANYRMWLLKHWRIIGELEGKNLVCWCPLIDKEGNKVHCHADILLEIANQ